MLKSLHLLLGLLCVLVASALVGCNDLPTEVGNELVPGTDTVYTATSDSLVLLTGASTIAKREPFINNTYVLFGKTQSSEARLFMQVTTYPNVGGAADFTVDTAQLIITPQVYSIGDTIARDFSAVGYEIQRPWSANVTWDSVWASDGVSSSYYTNSNPVVTSATTLPANDSTLLIPIQNQMIQRWLVLNADTTTRSQVYGLALLPQTGNTIRQYRNLLGSNQTMRIRVVYKHKDSTSLDTLFLSSVVACFVNTPEPKPTELIAEGARQQSWNVDVDLSQLPVTALLLNSSLRVTCNAQESVVGYGGLDEILSVTYTTKAGTPYSLRTRIDSTSKNYTFSNIAPLLQQIRKDGGVGKLVIQSDDQSGNRYWRMNRLIFFPLSASAEQKPKLTIVYALPSTLQ